MNNNSKEVLLQESLYTEFKELSETELFEIDGGIKKSTIGKIAGGIVLGGLIGGMGGPIGAVGGAITGGVGAWLG